MIALAQSPREPGFVQDPYSFYEHARAAGPLFVWEDFGFPCAAGFDTVNAVLRDRRFGREPPDGPPLRPAHLADFYAIDDNAMLDREPPVHTRLRGLVLRAFTSRRIAALRTEIEQLADNLIEAFDGDEVDLLPAFAQKLPVIVIARLLGVPEAMSDELLAWSNAMVAMYQARRDRTIEDGANRAAAEFAAFLRDYIAERRRAPRDDLLSALIAAESEGDRLSESELVATCVLLLNAGHEATVHTIGNGVATILLQRLDPQRLFPDETATIATVEEILRFDPPLHLFTRYAREDMEVFGHRFARGETVGLLLAAANRDPQRFPEPDRFDPARAGADQHLSFGAGLHFCVGAPLARLELVAAMPILFRRLPGLSLTAPPAYADRYHFHGLESLLIHTGSDL